MNVGPSEQMLDSKAKLRPILVLDDVNFSRNLLMGVFRGMGMRKVIHCDNERDARHLIEAHRFSVLFCNLSGKSQRTTEFIRQIRKDPRSEVNELPIVVSQLTATKSEISAIRDCGANEVLVPPITPTAVEAKLKRAFFGVRATVRADTYVGPDRRWRGADWNGEDRRGQMDPERPATEMPRMPANTISEYKRNTDKVGSAA